MSGKREAVITISEEEYRRLHEQDMRQRFGPAVGGAERQQITELQAQVRWLEQRLAAASTPPQAIQVSEQTLYNLLGDEQAGNALQLQALMRSAENPTAARILADEYRRAMSLLRPQLIGMTQYENQRRQYARDLLAVFRGEHRSIDAPQVAPVKSSYRLLAPSLRQRLQTASRLSNSLERVGYRKTCCRYAGPGREAALLQMQRPADNSLITIVVSWKETNFNGFPPQSADTSPTNLLQPEVTRSLK